MKRDSAANYTEALRRRSDENLQRLNDKFDAAQYQSVAQLPYVSRLALEKWHDAERARVEHWNLEPASKDLFALIELFNGKEPDRQELADLLGKDTIELSVDTLMTLVSESRIRGFNDSMRAKGRKKTAAKNEKRKLVAYDWLKYQAGLVDGIMHSKNSAAPLLAEKYHLSERVIRENYLARVEDNEEIFPDGVDAAKAELGIL